MAIPLVGEAFPPIDHTPWDGISLADFVMPFFDFIVGVSIALAFKRFDLEGTMQIHNLATHTINTHELLHVPWGVYVFRILCLRDTLPSRLSCPALAGIQEGHYPLSQAVYAWSAHAGTPPGDLSANAPLRLCLLPLHHDSRVVLALWTTIYPTYVSWASCNVWHSATMRLR
jgi:hypothetical protein